MTALCPFVPLWFTVFINYKGTKKHREYNQAIIHTYTWSFT